MINITRKEECCGCQACGDICPKGAISFKTDEEGIWYPEVNQDTCIDCHLCERVCPIINNVSRPANSIDPKTFILQAPNPVDRLKSASGGAYTLLINEVFNRGGYVAGHIWNDKASVKGFISCKPEDLDLLRGTKYLQSDVEGIYKAVKQLLNEGKFVLFSGCPCQTAAMRSFLKKDYDNLLMTDFVCMGIDSPLAFRKYIESLEGHYNSKMVFFKAKSKEVGWRYLTNKAQFENGKSYFGINNVDANLKATFLNVLVRPSCYECKFKSFPRVSDMTIGDYWRKSNNYDLLDDNTGTSYVMLHNDKAVAFFDSVKSKCHLRQVTIKDILGANPLAIKSLNRPSFSRDEFYQRLHNEDFITLVDEYYTSKNNVPKTGAVKRVIKTIIQAAYYNRKTPISFLQFIYYNLFSSKVHTNLIEGDVLIIRNTKLRFGKGSVVKVKGHCILDSVKVSVDDNSVLKLDNNLIQKGCSINLLADSHARFGYRTILSKNVYLHVASDLDIGEFCFIDNNVTVDSNDSDIVYFDGTDYFEKSIVIGTHTLLCQGSVINGGTNIGDESIIREHSVVKGVVPAQSMMSGVPAKAIEKNINWKHNFDFIWNYKN